MSGGDQKIRSKAKTTFSKSLTGGDAPLSEAVEAALFDCHKSTDSKTYQPHFRAIVRALTSDADAEPADIESVKALKAKTITPTQFVARMSGMDRSAHHSTTTTSPLPHH